MPPTCAQLLFAWKTWLGPGLSDVSDTSDRLCQAILHHICVFPEAEHAQCCLESPLRSRITSFCMETMGHICRSLGIGRADMDA